MRIVRKKNIKKRIFKYFAIGGFTFFLIKGLVWLVIFSIAGFNLINFG